MSGMGDPDSTQTDLVLVGALPDMETCLLSMSSCVTRGTELFLMAARMAYDEAFTSVGWS